MPISLFLVKENKKSGQKNFYPGMKKYFYLRGGCII